MNCIEREKIFFLGKLTNDFVAWQHPSLCCNCNITIMELEWEVLHIVYSSPSDKFCCLLHHSLFGLQFQQVWTYSKIPEWIHWLKICIILLLWKLQFSWWRCHKGIILGWHKLLWWLWIYISNKILQKKYWKQLHQSHVESLTE